MTITPERIAELRHRIADVGKVGTAIYLASSVPGVRHGPAVAIRCDDLSALLDLAESALAAKPAPVAEIDWGKVPEWAQWVAADPSGKVNAFLKCPCADRSYKEWLHGDGPVDEMRNAEIPGLTIPGPWDQSLRKRP